MDELCCGPRQGKGGKVPTGPLGSADTKLKGKDDPDDDEEEMGFGQRAISIFGGGKKSSDDGGMGLLHEAHRRQRR